jgi:hypothetical protein
MQFKLDHLGEKEIQSLLYDLFEVVYNTKIKFDFQDDVIKELLEIHLKFKLVDSTDSTDSTDSIEDVEHLVDMFFIDVKNKNTNPYFDLFDFSHNEKYRMNLRDRILEEVPLKNSKLLIEEIEYLISKLKDKFNVNYFKTLNFEKNRCKFVDKMHLPPVSLIDINKMLENILIIAKKQKYTEVSKIIKNHDPIDIDEILPLTY